MPDPLNPPPPLFFFLSFFLFIHSFNHSFIHSVYSFIHSFIHSFIFSHIIPSSLHSFLGSIGHPGAQCTSAGPGCPRQSRYTLVEQRAILTLWALVQSPLILGTDLTTLSNETHNLVAQQGVLSMSEDIALAFEALRVNTSDAGYIVWSATSKAAGASMAPAYIAVFNLWNQTQSVQVPLLDLGLPPSPTATALWPNGSPFHFTATALSASLAAHEVLLLHMD